MFSLLIGLAISMAVAMFGYSRARAFVSERLRYVDAVNHPFAPLMAGVGIAFALGALVRPDRGSWHRVDLWSRRWPRRLRRPWRRSPPPARLTGVGRRLTVASGALLRRRERLTGVGWRVVRYSLARSSASSSVI